MTDHDKLSICNNADISHGQGCNYSDCTYHNIACPEYVRVAYYAVDIVCWADGLNAEIRSGHGRS